MLNNSGDKSNFLKNPIGVLGIFLVLTEAIASLVIVKSGLDYKQNMILVWFIVLFPCLILCVFYLLVTRHHEKLYSPSDYKDEKNFVNTYNSATQKEEYKMVTSVSEEETESSNKDIVLIKNALVDIMELQKKIIPTVESSVLSEGDKKDYVSSIDDHISEIDEEGRNFKVEISPMYNSVKLVRDLSKQGYNANIYRLSFRKDKEVLSNNGHEAIWLGSEIPLDMAVNVLKTAKRYYPHLKYIQLTDCRNGAPEEVKYEIYIGGASSTAKERRLKALKEKDFNELYKLHTQDELHDFVRRFE